MSSGDLVRLVRGELGERAREARRDLTRPWREGRTGPAAEVGRWLGLGLALGATALGVVAAVRAGRRS